MKKIDLLPHSLRTIRRAKALLVLSKIEPTTNHHVAKVVKVSLSSVRRLMREFIEEDLVQERYHLYRLTSKGKRSLKVAKSDQYLIQYMEEELKKKELKMERPVVTRIGNQ